MPGLARRGQTFASVPTGVAPAVTRITAKSPALMATVKPAAATRTRPVVAMSAVTILISTVAMGNAVLPTNGVATWTKHVMSYVKIQNQQAIAMLVKMKMRNARDAQDY